MKESNEYSINDIVTELFKCIYDDYMNDNYIQDEDELLSYRRFDLVKLTTVNSAIQFIFAIQVRNIFLK
jgi:hypothetical protein